MGDIIKYTDVDIEFLKIKACEIYKTTKELEALFHRKFTIDGLLAGSIGEVFASYYYGIELAEAGKKTHDGEKDGRKIQIKMTQREQVDIKDIPENLIVLFISFSKEDVKAYEVYNGPGDFLIGYKRNSNQEISISLKKLSAQYNKVSDTDKIFAEHEISKYAI